MVVKVTNLSHEELVSIFSVGLYGSEYLSCSYDRDFYNSLSEGAKEGDCIEDKMADCLLCGGTITFFDEEDEKEYVLNMGQFLERLTVAINKDGNILNSLLKVVNEDDGGDYYDGDAILQGVLFGEIVYG